MIEIKNTYKLKCHAKYFYQPNNVLELKETINNLDNNNIKWYLLGDGSNIILPSEDFDGAIINLNNLNEYYLDDEYVFAYAGINLNCFINNMIDENIINFSELYGIPGTLGGALYGNAGANKKEIYDDLVSVLVYDGEVKLINKEDIQYSYRNTMFKNTKTIILAGVFRIVKGDQFKAKEIIKENMLSRKIKQPLEFPNAGSVFKNPENLSAGKLIDECNLKGLKVGGAMVSEKHANFIINFDNATSSDIISLIEIIKKTVKEKKNIDLNLEQIVVKW